jgi:hypothetical protein
MKSNLALYSPAKFVTAVEEIGKEGSLYVNVDGNSLHIER